MRIAGNILNEPPQPQFLFEAAIQLRRIEPRRQVGIPTPLKVNQYIRIVIERIHLPGQKRSGSFRRPEPVVDRHDHIGIPEMRMLEIAHHPAHGIIDSALGDHFAHGRLMAEKPPRERLGQHHIVPRMHHRRRITLDEREREDAEKTRIRQQYLRIDRLVRISRNRIERIPVFGTDPSPGLDLRITSRHCRSQSGSKLRPVVSLKPVDPLLILMETVHRQFVLHI